MLMVLQDLNEKITFFRIVNYDYTNCFALLIKKHHFKKFCSQIVIFDLLKNNNHTSLSKSEEYIFLFKYYNIFLFKYYKRSFYTSTTTQYQIQQKKNSRKYCPHFMIFDPFKNDESANRWIAIF